MQLKNSNSTKLRIQQILLPNVSDNPNEIHEHFLRQTIKCECAKQHNTNWEAKSGPLEPTYAIEKSWVQLSNAASTLMK